ncbi:MAG TPA: hypothetical protein VN894_10925 [Polyangiaceae bacterium]|nr:hypothetical protein [Polyangiaceae bacterium]
MRFEVGVVALAALSAFGCAKRASALDVCQKLQGAGVATNCQTMPPAGLGAAAVESAGFELTELPEHDGAVYRFDNPAAYDKAVDAFAASTIMGPNRYGSRKALVFVQISPDAPSDIAANVKRLVEGL